MSDDVPKRSGPVSRGRAAPNINVRATAEERERYKRVAGDVPLTVWMRDVADREVARHDAKSTEEVPEFVDGEQHMATKVITAAILELIEAGVSEEEISSIVEAASTFARRQADDRDPIWRRRTR